jgi:RNA polymerase sigma-70 factor (ECF subfamily)
MDTGRHEPDGAAQRPDSEWLGSQAEAALVERLKAGDESAYELLLERFQQPVYSLVYRLIDDPDDACDVTQEVFLKVFRNIGNFRAECTLKTWVYRIAVNEAHNRRRWFGRHRKPEVGLEADDSGRGWLDTLSDQTRSPFDLVLNEERRVAIEKALLELNPVFRSAVVLRDLEDLSYEEIADVLDVSLGTVKSRILRGRESLRRILMEQFEPSRGLQFTPQTVE